jgi:hypothetical protein
MFMVIPTRGEVNKTAPEENQIIWSDDFLRLSGAEFVDQQQQYEYCLYGSVPRPDYTAIDPLLSGGVNSASITIGNGFMGINHDEFRNPPPIPPFQICFATLGWQNRVAPCVGGSNLNEHDYPFDDNDICIYSGARFNPYHLRFTPINEGPWGADFRSGYAGVDDDGDGTTDWNLRNEPDYTAMGGNNQTVGTGGDFNDTNTPNHMVVLGEYDGTGGCTNQFPSIEEYDIRVTTPGYYRNIASNGLDDDLDGTVDNEPVWKATVRRICDNTFLALDNGIDDDTDGATDEGDETNMIFPSGQTVAMDRGLSLRFVDLPPGTLILCCGNNQGEWDVDIWPTQFVNGFVGVFEPSTISEFYSRNQKFNKGNPGFVDPHGPDGKAGVAGVDDDGNGLTDEFPTQGRPKTDDDGDGVTDEFDEVVLDELGERSAPGSDDADDVLGGGAEQIYGMRTNVGTASGIYVGINPSSGGGNLFSISQYVAFDGSTVEGANELGVGFYQPGVNYGLVFCSSGTCYGAQLWIDDDVTNPVETLGPVINTEHTGTELAMGGQQGGSALLHLMERLPVVTNQVYGDRFWAIEGAGNRPTVTVAQDRDKDGDVDGVDFSIFASCFNKAGNPPRVVGCTSADATSMDADNDGDVDGVDFSVFASCFNKAGQTPRAPGCYPVVSSITACGS